MNFISAIPWSVSPEIFSIGPITLRWYGLLFALGFIVGQNILSKIFKKEGKDEKNLETIVMYMVIGNCLRGKVRTLFIL